MDLFQGAVRLGELRYSEIRCHAAMPSCSRGTVNAPTSYIKPIYQPSLSNVESPSFGARTANIRHLSRSHARSHVRLASRQISGMPRLPDTRARTVLFPLPGPPSVSLCLALSCSLSPSLALRSCSRLPYIRIGPLSKFHQASGRSIIPLA